MKHLVLTIAIILVGITSSYSQDKKLTYSNNLSIVTGITQPLLLNGYNLAANYTLNRWVFEYSHGMALDYTNVLNSNYKDIVLSIKSPYSTGAGIGYRFFSNNILGMDLRAEMKVHGYDVQLNKIESVNYTNFDMGGGLYWQIRPFGKKNNGLGGIVIEPSIRYWANVTSSLDADYQYQTDQGNTMIHKPYPLNLFVGLSIGYTFGKK